MTSQKDSKIKIKKLPLRSLNAKVIVSQQAEIEAIDCGSDIKNERLNIFDPQPSIESDQDACCDDVKFQTNCSIEEAQNSPMSPSGQKFQTFAGQNESSFSPSISSQQLKPFKAIVNSKPLPALISPIQQPFQYPELLLKKRAKRSRQYARTSDALVNKFALKVSKDFDTRKFQDFLQYRSNQTNAIFTPVNNLHDKVDQQPSEVQNILQQKLQTQTILNSNKTHKNIFFKSRIGTQETLPNQMSLVKTPVSQSLPKIETRSAKQIASSDKMTRSLSICVSDQTQRKIN